MAVLLFFGACQKAPQITMTTSPTIDLSADGSSGTITFTANRDWTISCSEAWIHVNPSSGEKSKDTVTVTVRCDANTTYDDRSATVTIRAEDAVQTVTIKQPQNLGVIVPTQTFDIKADTKSIDVEVQANVDSKYWPICSSNGPSTSSHRIKQDLQKRKQSEAPNRVPPFSIQQNNHNKISVNRPVFDRACALNPPRPSFPFHGSTSVNLPLKLHLKISVYF